MPTLISIPIEHYQALVGRCLLASREYAILRNSVINHVPTSFREGNVVEILCALDDATLILDLARRVYPSAAPYIEKTMSLTREDFGRPSRAPGVEKSSYSSAEYRIKISGDTWHFCSNCSQWPTAEFVSSKTVRDDDPMCNECLVKKEHGECNSSP